MPIPVPGGVAEALRKDGSGEPGFSRQFGHCPWMRVLVMEEGQRFAYLRIA